MEKPEVGGLVHPDDQWVPVGDKNPLTDVKLGVVDQQRSLYVLLHHIPGPHQSYQMYVAHTGLDRVVQ